MLPPGDVEEESILCGGKVSPTRVRKLSLQAGEDVGRAMDLNFTLGRHNYKTPGNAM